jgi:hypothetical protein
VIQFVSEACVSKLFSNGITSELVVGFRSAKSDKRGLTLDPVRIMDVDSARYHGQVRKGQLHGNKVPA